VLQWLPDHATLVARLLSRVAEGGALAIQMPSGVYAPVRTFIREISEDAAWTLRMDHARVALTMEEPHVYYDALAPHARSVDLWETEYHHVMESSTAIVDWIATTGLRPFLEALHTADERNRFVAMLNERVSHAYARRSDGRVLFPFKRLFVIAYA
jgi:trans-aconitate 2-methyltransferase